MYSYVHVWRQQLPLEISKAKEFWLREGVVPKDQIDLRSNQLVTLLTNNDGQVLGVTTAYEEYIESMRHKMLIIRQYITPSARQELIPYELAKRSFNLLEEYYSQVANAPLGVMTIIENDRMLKKNYAVWPRLNLVYIGTTKEGQHIRVRFFENAKLSYEH